MAGHNDLKYTTYFNKRRSRIITHVMECSDVDKHNTGHKYDQGGWAYFAEEYAAGQFVEAISKHLDLESNPCKHCGGL